MRRHIIGLTGILILLMCSALIMFQRNSWKEEPAYLLRYADNQPQDYPTVQAAFYFSDLVYERTGGDVKINIYSNEQLGDEGSVIRQVQFGGIDMARVSVAQLIVHQPQMGVLTLPYLYHDRDHMWQVLDGEIGKAFLGPIGNSGLIALSWYDAGERNFYTREKVETLADLQGLTIRVQEANYMEDMIRALGAIPESLPYSLVYSRLSTGAVDGAENNWPSYEAMQHYRVAKYVLTDGHVRIPEQQIISAKTAAGLPEEYFRIIKECAEASAHYERELWTERERTAMEQAVREGAVITELVDEERKKFRDACYPLYSVYSDGNMDLVQKIINLNNLSSK